MCLLFYLVPRAVRKLNSRVWLRDKSEHDLRDGELLSTSLVLICLVLPSVLWTKPGVRKDKGITIWFTYPGDKKAKIVGFLVTHDTKIWQLLFSHDKKCL